MNTSKSLLIRAKQASKSDAWCKLVNIYEPLIAGWLRRLGVSESDLQDLTQDILIAITERLCQFEHNGRVGAFRNWVRQIVINRCHRFWARRQKTVPIDDGANYEKIILAVSDPQNELSRAWDREHDQFVLERVLQLVSMEFDSRTIVAFRRVTIGEESAKRVAQDLNVSVGQVYKFKFRVMKRLVEEAAGLVASEDSCDLFGSGSKANAELRTSA